MPAVKIDASGIFVQRGKTRVFNLGFSFEANDYTPADLTDIIPEIGEPAIVRMAVQRQPDTRLHCVRSDGTVGMLVREPANGVLAWVEIDNRSGHKTQDVIGVPGLVGHAVYSVAMRSVSGPYCLILGT